MPYREGKPLGELIPPDRRRLHAIGLVVVSMFAGGAIYALVTTLVQRPPTPAPIVVQVPRTGRLQAVDLAGPDGTRPLLPGRVAIVHVWLQGCADCMPAFEALRDLQARGGFGMDVPEINVSYGRSDPRWAETYGVRQNLLWDVGGRAVVQPLGISSFTTLVVEADGTVVHRGRPDTPGYADAVRAALREHGGKDRSAARELQQADVEAVVARQTPGLRSCWQKTAPDVQDVRLNVALTVDTDGRATNVSVSSGPPVLVDCVRDNVQTWRFPRPTVPTPLAIPLHLTRS